MRARGWPGAEHGREALGLGADALLDDLTALGEHVDLAFPLVHVDANMSMAGHHVKRGGQGSQPASSHLALRSARSPVTLLLMDARSLRREFKWPTTKAANRK